MTRRADFALASMAALLFTGCAQNPVVPDGGKHLSAGPATATAQTAQAPIPDPVPQSFALPRPKTGARTETHSVVVHNVKVQDLLFALARDARINIDVHPGIAGTVTLNALDQTLPQLLNRIARQVDMRWETQGDTLIVMPDAPFLRNYKVDYVNMSRDTSGSVSTATEISTGGTGISGQGGIGARSSGGSDNGSRSKVDNTSRHRLWETLVQNVRDLLRETDKLVDVEPDEAPAAAIAAAPGNARATTPAPAEETPRRASVRFREAASVIANPEAGVITVRASARQHEKVQSFLDRVLESARRQVLIEATIAEVDLSQNYQQGIEWSKLNLSGTGFQVVQQAIGKIAAPPSSLIELGFLSAGGSFNGSVKLLESFGTVKVLSSPKVSVLNNQTAVLKVVDNTVYFTIQSNTNQNQNQTVTTYTTEVHTVPIGLVMNVTPEIGDNDTVTLNVRPSLSRIVGKVTDPNPALKLVGITNEIPIIRSREMDSVIRVENGNIAIMGGLMEDAIDLNKDTVPVASSVPLLGALFQNRNDTRKKTELVILLRPTIVRRASLEGDYRDFRDALPKDDYFKGEAGPSLLNLEQIPMAAGAK
ncbi:pilus (MSHA type) biogenesis protein MshL [Niveibacterium sp. 24ML]|uniref:pilus (MSHA type) biogenesis protein MshL n=1 Tax=Niveibacterium sp. 24ML TaxID=2985512 RepID=UPI00226EC695|nr:pilus (MSHA type) biogenesis protein MshL [Niveibacterium sp. 24ML]MCX9154844.1 pilus (MSHA type) biogenesis protein MshL [Niveibacterium sp. 24ML]